MGNKEQGFSTERQYCSEQCWSEDTIHRQTDGKISWPCQAPNLLQLHWEQIKKKIEFDAKSMVQTPVVKTDVKDMFLLSLRWVEIIM